MMGMLQERCQIEMISNLQPVHLLFLDTKKEAKNPIFRGLHLGQPGGNHKTGKIHKNEMNGKDSKNGMDGEKGKNKYSIFDSSFYMVNLLTVRGPSVILVVKKLRIRSFFGQGDFAYR